MHVDQIIFPKFQGKYEKIKIPYFFTHEFPLKIFVKIVKPQSQIVVLKKIIKPPSVTVGFITFLKPQLLTVVLWLF